MFSVDYALLAKTNQYKENVERLLYMILYLEFSIGILNSFYVV
jgi:hypothetical protein